MFSVVDNCIKDFWSVGHRFGYDENHFVEILGVVGDTYEIKFFNRLSNSYEDKPIILTKEDIAFFLKTNLWKQNDISS